LEFRRVLFRSSASRGKNDWLDDYSEEFQIMGDVDGRHSWILGYYIEKQKYDLNYPPLFAVFGNALSPTFSLTVVGGFSANQEDEQKGYFAQGTFNPDGLGLGCLNLPTGYRRKDASENRDQIPAHITQQNLFVNLVPGNSFQDRPAVEDSAPSWTVSLDYQLNDDTLVYLAHRRGFKPGGTNTASNPQNPGRASSSTTIRKPSTTWNWASRRT